MTPRIPAGLCLSFATLLVAGAPSAAAAAVDAGPGGLRRAAWWRFRLVAAESGGAVVRALDPDSPAARAGLREGDAIARLDGTALANGAAIAGARRRVRGGDTVRLERASGGEPIAFTVEPLPLEQVPGCRVEYGSVVSRRGDRVRTVVTRPQEASGRLPALLFIPWLSCDPVETPLAGDGWHRVLREVAAGSGWMTMRVEKPGVGDSEGGDCGGNDLETDLDAFRAAIAELRRRPDVDPARIVLFGGSIGGALAPILAAELPAAERPAGMVVAGTFARTWFEHMLEFERARLTLQGKRPEEIHRAVHGFAEFYALYFGERLTPAQVIERRPDLAWLWNDAPDGQYGRPAAYFHQVSRLDPERAWTELGVPTLVLYGEFDWIMSRTEHEHIVRLVDAVRPGAATLVVLPGADHNFGVYDSPSSAFRGEGERYEPEGAERIRRWLAERAR